MFDSPRHHPAVRLRLEQLVQLMVYLQILITVILLGFGEESALLPLVMLAVIATSVYVTDYTEWLQLSQPIADFIALGIMLYSGLAAYWSDRQQLLIVVANLQCYLQLVLVFQRKTSRIFWQLALLSLGQLAIASTLVPGPMFGALLIAYLVAGTFSFSLLLLHDESAMVSHAITGRRLASAANSSTRFDGPTLTGAVASIESRTVLRGLSGTVSLVALTTTVLASLLFFSLPRWEVPKLEVAEVEPLRTVGFSTTVLLGELGEVVNNSADVARIKFFRGHSQRPMRLEGEPLFHGTVVTRYEDRRWSQGSAGNPYWLPTDPGGPIVRQRITAEPLDVREVFCIFPVFAMNDPDPRLRVDMSSNQLLRLEEYRTSTQEFEIATTGITGSRQREILPCGVPVSGRELEALSDPPPSAQFSGLRELAASIVAQKSIDPATDRVAAARALSEYLQMSGDFNYSLEPQVRDAPLDPLEDFVTLHRTGHCEYFAGALVLMLRSLDIPARMAIGFKGGEWNPFGMYYQIQQLHAHAWAEVYLEPNQIPPGELAFDEAGFGAWLTLDPTASDQAGGAFARDQGMMARLRQSLDYGRVLWINYVASLNSTRQRQAIYEPLAAGVDAGVENLTSTEVWLGRFDALANSRLGKFWLWYRRHWFSWRGGLVAVGFSLFAVGAFFAVRGLFQTLWSRGWFGADNRTHSLPVLEMYRRLETTLGRVGLTRREAQTAQEFALAAGGELSERLEYRRVAHLPRRIVDIFYRVRFGGRTLDNQEASEVEHALTELERTLRRVAPRSR